ncbi:hypothetical protein GWO43_03000 [candidate division KSB1 bacterium]|nr:hypothetical protein [candidate division KSB1 bacterium]NIR69993.1 hypothetical protein [candidate division KSB1 bacterium]NIS23016.1 hypothetical protein [candidate division KSB1 bacterium]NIT69874.1 hypothetical protein [candidate division KSB1 bacterium]NIU23523.1 hypothetical protein [candidate division KSB1 bacterium]
MGTTSGLPQMDDKNNDGAHSVGPPIADIVSLESVVSLLIRKGVCTPEELFEEERKKHQQQQNMGGVSFVHTKRDSTTGGGNQSHRKSQNFLKRKMSKHRWSRKLGTALFGWKWKKVKRVHEDGKHSHHHHH